MVWKKTDEAPHPEPAPAMPRVATAPPAEPVRRPDRPSATIGPSIFIKGDLTGDEDLVIEGRVEGRVDLKNNVTVGKNGRVRADVFGKSVIIEGEVDGNLFAQEQAILRQSGAVRGNITAPRVILEDGSRFRGSIDMDAKEPAKGSGAAGSGATAGGGTSAASSPASVPAGARADAALAELGRPTPAGVAGGSALPARHNS
jgi:cytoskeletal protein CcmA (bactofilin family)